MVKTKKYTIGLDFGTNSCRSLIVDISNGRELATHVFNYPSGEAGIIVDSANPNLARQNPADYLLGLEVTIREALRKASQIEPDFSPKDVIGIGVDTTGSSPMPVDQEGLPLCFQAEFKANPSAMVWLWKDHTSYAEAQKITELARQLRPQYLAKIGGVYSSEWFWSKLWHLQSECPEVFQNTFSFVEICDWIPAVLTGNTDPLLIKRSICAAGHKALFNEQWGGLPDEEFLSELSPEIAAMRQRLYRKAYSAEEKMGNLSPEWAEKLGLTTEVAVAVGAFDAHMGAVGAGIATGILVKILGTSTCDIMVWPNSEKLNDIPGVCGIVDGSVLKGYFGIEAGQSAVGDIFLWFVNNLVPDSFGKTQEEKFENLAKAAGGLKPGESGLLALDWNNGNRTILVDVRLTGLLVGQTLHTQAHEIYRALIEATAYGALAIIDRIESYGVPVREIVNCGGLAVKNPLLMQIYADVTGRPMKVSTSEQTPALGAAIFAALAGGKAHGGYDNITEAQRAMTSTGKEYLPDNRNHQTYKELYTLYKQMHDAFGTPEWSGKMFNVMKDLLNIRDRVRQEKLCSKN
ncbi:MAG TPA: ribulokinase [Candidatus Marinimicrobia bacterium]|nr:ribulokinase [Candidatus Neomarinimicrobiota bacterium]